MRNQMICIEGLLIPSDWDNDGNVIGLTIATTDEREYRIADRSQVTRLTPFLRKRVMIKGSLQEEKEKTYLHVQKIIQRKCPR
jgi:hypothetical protein